MALGFTVQRGKWILQLQSILGLKRELLKMVEDNIRKIVINLSGFFPSFVGLLFFWHSNLDRNTNIID